VWRSSLATFFDEHVEVAEHARGLGDRALERGDLAHVARAPPRRLLAAARGCVRERGARLLATSMKATRAPCAQNASTIAAPMPEPPPVMKTRRPRRLGYVA
jgi:hypothetical protein